MDDRCPFAKRRQAYGDAGEQGVKRPGKGAARHEAVRFARGCDDDPAIAVHAKKSFERCLKEIPTHPALPVTLYGLFAVHLAEGDRQQAEPLLQRLESCCPDSEMTRLARQDLDNPPQSR